MPRPDRKPDKYGAEHDVFLTDDGWRVLKFGRNFGFVPVMAGGKLALKPATPEEYLVRHALMERVFPTEVTVEGLTDSGYFVISQRVITGNHPTEWGVRKYLRKLGFVNVPASFGQGGMAWFHNDLRVLIMDTSPDNFVAAPLTPATRNYFRLRNPAETRKSAHCGLSLPDPRQPAGNGFFRNRPIVPQ